MFFYEELSALGLSFIYSQANFVFIHLPCKAEIVCDQLIHKGFVVRSMASFGCPDAVRVSVGREEENIAFFKAFSSILKGLTDE